MLPVPDLRIRVVVDRPEATKGDYVLYWMTAARRAGWNFALDRALERARALDRPLLVFEPLRAGYRWASDRHHRFVLDGMRANREAFAAAGVDYLAFVEPEDGAGKGLLAALAKRAALVVTDDAPLFFLPRMLAAAARTIDRRIEAVDSVGLLPLGASDRAFPTAYAFRRFLQGNLRPHLGAPPARDLAAAARLPRGSGVPAAILRRWPAADDDLLGGSATALAELPIDHDVPPAPFEGGTTAGRDRLRGFVASRLGRYADDRNDIGDDAASGLSPWLHFGQVAAWEVFDAVARAERWSPNRLGDRANGKREGWWGMSPGAEAFLDQMVTWRELGHLFARHRDDSGSYDSLPEWAKATLEQHAKDRRSHLYSLAEFEEAGTHDPLWNAAQRQLRVEGRIQNYLRMLWGKKIVEWTRSPREAAATMLALNDRWALDGRDPNSESGIFWCLGRYDRPWAPARPVFGTIRWMSSENTARKMDVRPYLRRWGPDAPRQTLFPT